MDDYYQDIHIENYKNRKEKVIREVHIVQIDMATKEIKITYSINGVYEYILITKKNNKIIID